MAASKSHELGHVSGTPNRVKYLSLHAELVLTKSRNAARGIPVYGTRVFQKSRQSLRHILDPAAAAPNHTCEMMSRLSESA